MTPEILKTIRRIQIQTTRLAKDILAGLYRSAFKGRGMEFEEVREFQSGDDIRTIDWPVTSRMNHPYVKLFREERELTVMLLVDVSSSTHFGTRGNLKSTLIAEIGAVLAFSAIRNNDKVGLILFSNQVEKYIPPRSSLRHVLRVIRELLLFKPQFPKTDINEALEFLGHTQAKPCVCFLISDFICPDFSQSAALITPRHDLIGICVTDPREFELPEISLTRLKDLESGLEKKIDTFDKEVQKTLKAKAQQRLLDQKNRMNKLGADFVDIRTDQSYVIPLRRFFKLRSLHPK